MNVLKRIRDHFRPVAFSDGLPDGWTAVVEWKVLAWVAYGIYNGPEVTEPVLAVSGHCWTLRSACERVRYWIADAAAHPAEWMPEVSA